MEKAAKKLTYEIIDYFRLPKKMCYRFIYDRITWAIGVGFDIGRSQSKFRKAVVQSDDSNNIVRVYGSVREAAREHNIDRSTLSKACRGEYLGRLKGFKWRYLDSFDYEKAKTNKLMP
jgi:hypothetical protein